jgi:repressor LexA
MDEVMRRLTANQKKFYESLKGYIVQHGRSPTVAEMAKAMRFSSPRSVTQYLEALEERGLIRRWRYKSRGVELVSQGFPASEGTVNIPVIASAGCDQMSVFAEQTFDDYLCVNRALLAGRRQDRIVSIRAIGNSMDEAGCATAISCSSRSRRICTITTSS